MQRGYFYLPLFLCVPLNQKSRSGARGDPHNIRTLRCHHGAFEEHPTDCRRACGCCRQHPGRLPGRRGLWCGAALRACRVVRCRAVRWLSRWAVACRRLAVAVLWRRRAMAPSSCADLCRFPAADSDTGKKCAVERKSVNNNQISTRDGKFLLTNNVVLLCPVPCMGRRPPRHTRLANVCVRRCARRPEHFTRE